MRSIFKLKRKTLYRKYFLKYCLISRCLVIDVDIDDILLVNAWMIRIIEHETYLFNAWL